MKTSVPLLAFPVKIQMVKIGQWAAISIKSIKTLDFLHLSVVDMVISVADWVMSVVEWVMSVAQITVSVADFIMSVTDITISTAKLLSPSPTLPSP